MKKHIAANNNDLLKESQELTALREAWIRLKAEYAEYLSEASELHLYVYFLFMIEKRKNGEIAELLNVKPPRVTKIVNDVDELLKKGGENHEKV